MEHAILISSDDESSCSPDPTDSHSNPAVTIDPALRRQLRDHQVIGVQFMYDCIMGRRGNFYGCILADSMGLGKTAQVLTLIATVRRNFNKVAIVVPAGLLPNWKLENEKWLGRNSLPMLVCVGGKASQDLTVRRFLHELEFSVLLISYNLFSKHFERLNSVIELIIFDESHKLKSKEAKLVQKINDLQCKRRILLTGTPLQNNLEEFYNCAYIACPDFMMERKKFMKKYEHNIMQYFELSEFDRVKHKGHSKLDKLKEIASRFMLRREVETLDVLTSRYEYRIFCRLTSVQFKLYKALTEAYIDKRQRAELEIGHSMKLITMLQKLANHPDILLNKLASSESFNEQYGGLFEAIDRPTEQRIYKVKDSTKFKIMDKLLKCAKQVGDNTIICSNYTSTLDAVEAYLLGKDISFLRIDGKTLPAERQLAIDKFKQSLGEFPVFLLSSKAGGIGINLIGGNRMIMMEPDWNPSNDLQAMGRIWREGQMKPVYIYRLYSSGTLEEKIHQLQLAKTELSNMVLDKKAIISRMTEDELYDIFRLYSSCQSYQPRSIDFTEHKYYNSFLSEAAELIEAIEPEIKIADASDMDEGEGLPRKKPKI